jgi:hypothetical protein
LKAADSVAHLLWLFLCAWTNWEKFAYNSRPLFEGACLTDKLTWSPRTCSHL